MLSRLRDRPWTLALLIGAAAQLLFCYRLGAPSVLTFDEVHYVPAARTLWALAEPANTEHPLVAKELIGLGIHLFGDNPIGWRALSTLAGTATVLGVFAILWLLFGRARIAVLGAVFVLLNQTVYIQARIAMLEGFLGAFVTCAIAALLWAMRGPRGRVWPRLLLSAVLFGLSVGTKWVAAPYVAFACLLILWTKWRDRDRYFPGVNGFAAVLVLGLVSIATYFLTFLPAFFYRLDPMTLGELIPFQHYMYERQTQLLPPHPYQSDWWSWPLLIRPIWYFYEPDGGVQRGVLLIGNPVIWYGGLVAVAACLWAGLRRRSAAIGGAGLLWVASLALWAAIPKSLGFFYYYHLSGIFLCVAIAAAFHAFPQSRRRYLDEIFLFAALFAFFHFWPILSAAPLDGPGAFNRWMWFDSWR
ncbi:phospholipid carrier-dependent glycosyltransferase [Sphingomonas sp. MJ1 (PH-R8)]|uniref:phospholipid carrier-dependent glycosyltransferase n=1 Tax=Sphingomonas sp. MJ1 (PH-R8) TaxID=3112950 RepID=UPI003A8624A9